MMAKGMSPCWSGFSRPFASSSSGITILSFSTSSSSVSAPVASPGTSSLVATQTPASGSHAQCTVYGSSLTVISSCSVWIIACRGRQANRSPGANLSQDRGGSGSETRAHQEVGQPERDLGEEAEEDDAEDHAEDEG